MPISPKLPIPAYQAPKQKRRIAKTLLVAVDCLNVPAAAISMQKSMAQAEFEEAIFFTDAAWDTPELAAMIAPARVVTIPKINSYEEYSRFMMKDLYHHVTRDFVLVTQWDGHILDGAMWSPLFQQYDYIGAVWSFYPQGDPYRVGNGGFSLRSRRLLAALQDDRFAPGKLEDNLICRQYRPILESEYDIVFADDEIAAKFAIEHAPRTAASFGFHGKFNFPWALGCEETARIVSLSPSFIKSDREGIDISKRLYSDVDIGLLLYYFLRGDEAGLAAMRRALFADATYPPEQLAKLFNQVTASPSVGKALATCMGLV
ncbi:MAG: DUF5672 family protein [Candidatus Symbiobacter sp.]|nr:DUF5672 family protein [Candidatus Symbiobacter sp.]